MTSAPDHPPESPRPPDDSLSAKLAALRGLVDVVERLRAPDGCPWDREQTIHSLRRNFLEESCEVIDAIEETAPEDAPRSEAICEELGDILMNIVLAARIAEEAGGFDLARVASDVTDKLVRRHPHVFGDATADDAEAVLSRWEEIKADEKRSRQSAAADPQDDTPRAGGSILDRVPASLPPLEAAHELSRRAAGTGFDWPSPPAVLEKVREELDEVSRCLEADAAGDEASLGEEIGDLLFSVVNLARKVDMTADGCLRAANRKFRRRFERMERHSGGDLGDGEKRPLEELEKLWQQAKSLE